MISKQISVLLSGIISFFLITSNWIGTYKLCGAKEYGNCMDFLYSLMLTLSPIIVFFLFALLTYLNRDNTYRSWFKFARWWIPLSMIAIFLAPEYSNDWVLPIEKGVVALFACGAFAIISTLIVLYSLFSKKTT